MNKQQNFIWEYISITKTASILWISTATVNNWVKTWIIKSIEKDKKNLFNLKDIENLKNNIKDWKIQKLNWRANKSNIKKSFIPNEYINSKEDITILNDIVTFIDEKNIDIDIALFLLSINLINKENLITNFNIDNIISGNNFLIKNKQLNIELLNWKNKINFVKINKEYTFLLDCKLPNQRDVLWSIYQSILPEGVKSENGSYYTPKPIVEKIVKEYIKDNYLVLDPCCWTWQFLLSFAEKIKEPINIYWFDIDEIAVKIARINLILKFKDKDFIPNIFCKNSLFEKNEDLFNLNNKKIEWFDLIATNPPWWAHLSKEDNTKLKTIFPNIISWEIFSYIIKKSIDLLKKDWIISFVLPESILNVKTHEDIREYILNNTSIKQISYLNRVFKKVFTNVIRLDLVKNKTKDNKVNIINEDKNYSISQLRWLNNNNFLFDIHSNDFDEQIISKIYKYKHITLKDKAEWALWIVTWNNKKYILSERIDNSEPIYKWKDLENFKLKEPSNYIVFTPNKFQQVAPIEKYRAKEKLIYKFISKRLVFAYDDKQSLTLNSANIIIPKIENYPIKVIVALLNSSLYQFIFQKKFSSIKVLKNHIEQLPLPIWETSIFEKIIKLVNNIINNNWNIKDLDKFLFKQFNLTEKEITHILNSIK